jgi:hypothetical protein
VFSRADLRGARLLGDANRKLYDLPPGVCGAETEATAVDRVVGGANRRLEAVDQEASLADRNGRRQTHAVFGLP